MPSENPALPIEEKTESVHLTLGHSPDPDDAFMFCALADHKIPSEGLEFEHLLQDIETLNRRAERSELDITALSAHAYAFLTDRYVLLNSGASMGRGYGPMIVARGNLTVDNLGDARIAVPGERTSAFLALKLFRPDFDYFVAPFDQILDKVEQGEADAGLLIHEGQLTFADRGLRLVLDLGVWWASQTNGLPLPLGVNAIRRDLPEDIQRRADRILRDSIAWGLENRAEALRQAARWGRDLDPERTDRFVGMYVNNLTLDYGEEGRRALDAFFDAAGNAGLIPRGTRAEFVPREKPEA